MTQRQLAKHFAAHVQERKGLNDFEAIITMRRLAVTVAVETYGADEGKAIAWLATCGFTAVDGLDTYYKRYLRRSA